MDERYIAAVDLGSSKIAVTVAKIDGKDTQILYYRETPSLGVRDSAVLNPKMAGKELGKAIEQAESELKIKILQVVVGLPRYCVTQQKASAKIVRTDPEASISEEEIESAIKEKFADLIASGNKGAIMKAVMGELKGKADGKLINQVVAKLTK